MLSDAFIINLLSICRGKLGCQEQNEKVSHMLLCFAEPPSEKLWNQNTRQSFLKSPGCIHSLLIPFLLFSSTRSRQLRMQMTATWQFPTIIWHTEGKKKKKRQSINRELMLGIFLSTKKVDQRGVQPVCGETLTFFPFGCKHRKRRTISTSCQWLLQRSLHQTGVSYISE